MGDLTSRKYLIDVLRNVPDISGLGIEPVIAVQTVIELIEAVPNIDAIPVEWLEMQIAPFSDKLKDEVRGVFNATIREMIYRWRQEQEAQDG